MAADLDLTADVDDLASLLLFTPLELPEGTGGSVAAQGKLKIPMAETEKPSGDLRITRLRLDTRDRPDLLRSEAEFRARFEGARVRVDEVHAVGDGIDLRLQGVFDGTGEKPSVEARATGTADAAVLGLLVPDLGLEGQLVIDVAANGPLANPALGGTVRLEGGRYRAAGYVFDEIEGGVRLIGSSGELEGVRAKVGEGEAFAAGSFRIAEGGIRDFRITLQGRRVSVRAIPAMRLTVDADLVATGGGGRQRAARRDHLAARHLLEGRRAHGLGPVVAEPAGRRARRARALEGADDAGRAHRLGGLAGGAQQPGAPVRDRRPDGARHAGRSDPSRPGAPGRGRARHLQRHPLRDRGRHHHVQQHDADRAVHRPAGARRHQGIRPRGEPGRDLAPRQRELHVEPASDQRSDPGPDPERLASRHAQPDAPRPTSSSRRRGASCRERSPAL